MMGTVTDITPQSITIYLTATYADGVNLYEIVFTKDFHTNIGYLSIEVVNVEKDGMQVADDNPIWAKIQEDIQTQADKNFELSHRV